MLLRLEAAPCLTTLPPMREPLAKRALAVCPYQVSITKSVWLLSRLSSICSSICLSLPRPSRWAPPRFSWRGRAECNSPPTKCSSWRGWRPSQGAALLGMQGKTIPAVSDGEICDCEIARGKHGGAITDGSSLGSAFAALVKTLVLGDQRVIHVGRQKVVRGCLRVL